ncbi:hypothetical protein C8E99_0749 [Citricoccus muralis]|uniref:Uncharacterized protein n=1 Tax=Citricoccus muralis TaxID=169134 RepID=A0A3D9LBB8_9MICC|nr:hypothetical protein C8E99_0749 [Citricoccus muralis]
MRSGPCAEARCAVTDRRGLGSQSARSMYASIALSSNSTVRPRRRPGRETQQAPATYRRSLLRYTYTVFRETPIFSAICHPSLALGGPFTSALTVLSSRRVVRQSGLWDPLVPSRTLTPNEMVRAYRRVAPEIHVPFGVDEVHRSAAGQDLHAAGLRHQFRQPGLQVPPAHRVARRRCEGRRRHTAMPDPVRPAEFVVHLGREGNEFVPFRRRSRPARRTDGCGTVGSGAHHRSGNRRPIVTRISCPPPVILSSVPLILWGVIATIRGSGFERRAHAAALFVIESVVRRSSVLHNERVRSRQDGQMRVDHKDASASFVVTGASGGIGQVISKHLSAVGHVVNLDPTPAHNTDARVHCLEVDAGDPPQRSRPLNPPRSMPPWSAG